MKKLAVTGSLAAGKSTVCRLLQEKGAVCVSADAIVSQFLEINHPIADQLIQLFGRDVVEGSGLRINEKYLADQLFGHPKQLAVVEQIMHPQVWKLICEAYRKAPSHALVFVAEVPLLYEVGWQSWFDAVIFVEAPYEVRLARFLIRPQASVQSFTTRQARLLDHEEKKRLSDYIVNTHTDLSDVSKQLDIILQDFLGKTWPSKGTLADL